MCWYVKRKLVLALAVLFVLGLVRSPQKTQLSRNASVVHVLPYTANNTITVRNDQFPATVLDQVPPNSTVQFPATVLDQVPDATVRNIENATQDPDRSSARTLHRTVLQYNPRQFLTELSRRNSRRLLQPERGRRQAVSQIFAHYYSGLSRKMREHLADLSDQIDRFRHERRRLELAHANEASALRQLGDAYERKLEDVASALHRLSSDAKDHMSYLSAEVRQHIMARQAEADRRHMLRQLFLEEQHQLCTSHLGRCHRLSQRHRAQL